MRSVITVVFANARSQLLIPAERTSGRVRDTLPNVNGAGCLNCDVSNQPFRRLWADPPSAALTPVELGRTPPPSEPVEFGVAVRWIGCPILNVAIPSSAQPEISFEAAPCTPASSGWPWPKGRSIAKLDTS